MPVEIVGNLPPQYLDLLNRSASKIDMSPHDVSLALRGLSEKTPDVDNQAKLLKLLKAIAVQKFPFIILASGNDHHEIKSATLLPDPQMVGITLGGERVFHTFSRYEDFETKRVSDSDLVAVVKQKITSNLARHPQRDDMKPHTVAIARTKNTFPPDPKHSLSFGFPYLRTMREIQMGLIGKAR